MTVELSEEDMRRALFGSSSSSNTQPSATHEPPISSTHPVNASLREIAKSRSPKLRVTLHVTKMFEGDTEVLVYDANTLSTFAAEQEAKAEAKKKKYKYIDVVSIMPIG
jgi:hypothetical protein